MMLTVRQVSALWCVSIGCIYQLIRSGDLPAYRIGTGRGTIRISKDDAEGLRGACRTTKGPKRPPLKSRRAAEVAMSGVDR